MSFTGIPGRIPGLCTKYTINSMVIRMSFVHLHVHSPFSFLDGAGRLEDLIGKTAAAGMPALALTDHDNVAGAVFFHELCLKAGIQPIIGAEVTLEQGYHLILLAQNAEGYANLCRLLTRAHLDHPRGEPRTSMARLREYRQHLIALSGCRKGEIPSLLLQKQFQKAFLKAKEYRAIFGSNFYLELEQTWLPGAVSLNRYLAQLSEATGVPLIVTNNVHYTEPEQFPVHDLLTCVRTLTRLTDVHPQRPLNQENYLKTPAEMKALFPDYPEAVNNTMAVAEKCSPVLELNARHYPEFKPPNGEPAQSFLRRLVYEGASRRYGSLNKRVRERLEDELSVINDLGYADYFLLVWDVTGFARNKGIRYAGRGSAADSLVSYCLYLTEVDSLKRGLLFERFMSRERGEKPDIDIDFDARYRDQVAGYVYRKYGDEHVASVGTYNTFRARSAVRDLGKAMGFSLEECDRIAKLFPHAHADAIPALLERLPELRKSDLKEEKYRQLFDFCTQVAGLPRFMGTHLGGLVISRHPLTAITPLQQAAKGVVVTQFDKEAVELLGLVKLDLLSLRMMSALDDTIRIISREKAGFREERIPEEDRDTFQMVNRGDTIGVFQLESPAQRALQKRLGASRQEDLVASLALIRPGPIKGNMVEPFIKRKQGLEEVTYLHPKLEPILKKTRGVVLFQEQVIEIAMAVAGFTPGEADRLRRVMSHSRSRQEMEELGRFFVAKAQEQGVAKSVAEEIFSYIMGYASYGFCEAHAAAFAATSYKSAYLACHYPAYYFASLLSHQPMGYYDADTLCVEARRRGIKILLPHINKSGRDFVVEEGNIRVSLAQVKGMSKEILARILKNRPYGSIAGFQQKVKAPGHILENLIFSGAFDELHPNRKELLWQIPLLEKGLQKGFFPDIREKITDDFTMMEKYMQEKEALGIYVRGHPMTLFRQRLQRAGFYDSKSIDKLPDGAPVKAAGILIRPHRPPTRSGKTIVFFSLEDEYGLIDVTVFEEVYQRYGQEIFGGGGGVAAVTGTIQTRGTGQNLIAEKIMRM